MSESHSDVLIIGGGFAGLSAALWLGRFRRSVRVLDTGAPRNQGTWAVHGFPGLPDLPPHELRQRIRDQAIGAGATIVTATARHLSGSKDDFEVGSDAGLHHARRVLFAFGRQDRMPAIEGAAELFGRSLFHCPDCDGPSVSGARVAVLGNDRDAAALALYLLTWAGATELLTDGTGLRIDDRSRSLLDDASVAALDEPIHRLAANPAGGARITFGSGAQRDYDGVFAHLPSEPASDLAERAGCRPGPGGSVETDRSGETSVSGLYAAGDLTGPPFLAVNAAAQGVTAALAIHRSLMPAAFRL